jgi:hypothetical protein
LIELVFVQQGLNIAVDIAVDINNDIGGDKACLNTENIG